MLRHYFKTAARSLLKKKLYTLINIISLSVGLSLALVVVGHISYEVSFEDCHLNKDRIYRVEYDYHSADTMFSTVRTILPLGEAIRQEIPEIENATVFRVDEIGSMKVGDRRYQIINEYKGAGYAHGNKLVFADSRYLQVFTFPLREGNPETALKEPYSVLLSEKAAAEYFPGQYAIGQVVEINDRYRCQVTGVLKNIPQNTQLYTDFVISYATLESSGEELGPWEGWNGDFTYLLVTGAVDKEVLAQKIAGVAKKFLSPEDAAKFRYHVKGLKDIYFSIYGSGNYGELSPAGEISMMYEMGMVAFFILIQAIANFVNLATARSSDRMKEVGVRKVFGASRSNLFRQFMGESIIIVTVSMLASVLLYEIFKLSLQYTLLPRETLVDFYRSPLMLAILAGLLAVVGLVAGFYPALYLSRFKPIAVLQGKRSTKSSRSLLRKSLVVIQFAIAAIFVLCSTTILRQYNLISSIDRNFDYDNMVVIDFDGEQAAESSQLMKNEIVGKPNVRSVTVVNYAPGRESNTQWGFYLDEERKSEDRVLSKVYSTDADFVSHFGLELVEGRDLGDNGIVQASNAILISESMAKELGPGSAIGKKVYTQKSFHEVAGVIKDFYGASLNFCFTDKSVIRLKPEEAGSVVIKLGAGDKAASLAAIRDTYTRLFPEREFLYKFLAEDVEKSTADTRGQGQMFLVLALFAIGIACLGILGLVSYTAEQRTKEIGVRRVLGASVGNIMTMLSKEFVVLLVIANLIGWPLGWLLMQDFLKWFPFKVGIGIGTFAFVGGIILLFALLTASVQSIKAATANPVDSLRHE